VFRRFPRTLRDLDLRLTVCTLSSRLLPSVWPAFSGDVLLEDPAVAPPAYPPLVDLRAAHIRWKCLPLVFTEITSAGYLLWAEECVDRLETQSIML